MQDTIPLPNPTEDLDVEYPTSFWQEFSEEQILTIGLMVAYFLLKRLTKLRLEKTYKPRIFLTLIGLANLLVFIFQPYSSDFYSFSFLFFSTAFISLYYAFFLLGFQFFKLDRNLNTEKWFAASLILIGVIIFSISLVSYPNEEIRFWMSAMDISYHLITYVYYQSFFSLIHYDGYYDCGIVFSPHSKWLFFLTHFLGSSIYYFLFAIIASKIQNYFWHKKKEETNLSNSQ